VVLVLVVVVVISDVLQQLLGIGAVHGLQQSSANARSPPGGGKPAHLAASDRQQRFSLSKYSRTTTPSAVDQSAHNK
jgi:hypothetical protein